MAHLSATAQKQIEEIIARYQNETTPLIMILSDIQKEYGYIPLEVQELISSKIGVPVAEIYGVVTFYSFFTMVPKGENVINICLGTACFVRGSDKLLAKVEEILKIKNGETTPDGKFTVTSLRCVGACGLAPVMQINGKTYGNLKPEDVEGILAQY